MKPLSCVAARRRLQAYHDGELQVAEQIAVSSHLAVCGECLDVLGELEAIGLALREASPGRTALAGDDADGFQASVVSRVKAERDVSLASRVRGLFDDLHLVYAGLGAAAATAVCLIIMFGMMRFASRERPDSLAAMMTFLAMPSSSADTIALDAASHARWTARFQAATESAEQDAVFTLAAVVTREGRIPDLERLRNRNHKASVDEARMIEGLMDVVTRARLEGSPLDGIGSSANLVWLVTHTTVRATTTGTPDFVLPPPAKKRVASYLASHTTVA